VRDIVFEKKKTSYKEVADLLISETKSKIPLSKQLSVSKKNFYLKDYIN
jgi:hypothetical protein